MTDPLRNELLSSKPTVVHLSKEVIPSVAQKRHQLEDAMHMQFYFSSSLLMHTKVSVDYHTPLPLAADNEKYVA